MRKRMLGLVAIAAMLAAFIVLPVSAEVSIPEGVSEFNGHYYYVCDDGMTWDEAYEICKEMGGYLATVTSAEEEAFIESLIESGTQYFYWLGGTDEAEEGIWTWITGETWDYDNWLSKQPDNYSETDGVSENYLCINKEKKRWNDLQNAGDSYKDSVIENAGFICEWDDVVIEDDIEPITGEFNGHTYAVYNDSMTWQEAKAACEAMSGYLVTITSAEEQAFIETLLENGTKKQYWIGLISDGNQEWVTGEEFSYSNWDAKEPNLSRRSDGERECYVHIYNVANPKRTNSQRFKWNDMYYDNTFPNEEDNFSLSTVGYICEWGDVAIDDLTDGQAITSFDSIVSDWAKEEIEEAYEENMIPEVLQGKNLTERVDRAEFASIAVKLYENLSDSTAVVGRNPFTDIAGNECKEDILKAYNLDITVGTEATLFSPNDLITREQVATMLTRTYKRSEFDGWTYETDSDYVLNYNGVKKFADDDEISDYAKESVYFMVKWGIINGMGDNTFAPHGNILFEDGYGYATREEAIVIALRTAKYL